jgi:hypothetical protein
VGQIAEWNYPGPLVIPTKGPPGSATDMPDMDDASYYGASDGWDTRSSQINSLRDLAIDNRSWIFTGPFIGQTVTVGKSGAVQFNTIQDAIDHAVNNLGPAADNRILIRVWPGEYNELITVPAWLSVKGVGEPQDVVVWNNTGTVCTCTAGFSGLTRFPAQVANLTLRATPTATGSKLLFANQGGELLAERVDLRYSPTGTHGTAIDVDVGSIRFRGIRGWYVHTGAGGGEHRFIDTNQLAGVIGLGAEIVMTIESDDDVTGYDSLAVVGDQADIVSTHMDITVSHASYSSQCIGIRHAGPASNIHFNSGRLTIRATGGSVTGDGTGIYLGNAAAQISSIGSKIDVSGFSNNWHADGPSGTLKTHFDLVEADGGVNPASGITHQYAFTGSAGNFTVRGTIFLDNDGGRCIELPTAAGTGAHTNYIIDAGGGGAAGFTNEGGTFKIEFDPCPGAGGTSENEFIVDLNLVDWAYAPAHNDFIVQGNNFLAVYGIVVEFGGWNAGGYGFALQRRSGTELASRALYFDNQVPVSSVARSIDFRINGTNHLSVENNGTLLLGSGASPSYQLNCSALSLGGALNINLASWVPQTANHNALMQLSSTAGGTYAGYQAIAPGGSTLESSVVTTTAYLTTYQGFLGSSAPDTIVIGETPGSAVLGTVGFLTSIQFYFNNAEECRIAPDLMTFNNGAVDTNLDWATSGELGLQVAATDVLRLTASQIQCIQDLVISDAQNLVLNATTGTKIGTATTQKLGFYNATPIVRPAALTAALTQISHTGPTTPDYAIAAPVDSGVGSAWGFSTQDEFETVMSVVLNLQTRVDELETKLQALGLLA